MVYKNIRDLREDADYSQAYVAKILDMSQRSYSNYENGISQLKPEMLIKLAALYDVSVDYLLGITAVKNAYPKEKPFRKQDFNFDKQ